jgi:cytochrome c-type biogenesis protein CcmH
VSKLVKLIGFVLWFCLANIIYANTTAYTFAIPAQQQRFYALTQELRCLVCQNQSLADSNATLAQDLRLEVAKQIQNGASDKQIKDYLVQRYGEFVLYRPRWQTSTYILWVAPWLLLVIGISGLLLRHRWIVREKKA